MNIFVFCACLSSRIFVPMDLSQTNHLKAYGVAYRSLEVGLSVEWLVNYRSGSFIMEDNPQIEEDLKISGVVYAVISPEVEALIKSEIERSNADVILLQKAPKVAVYQTPTAQPWDDAVVLALDYAGITYDRIWDREVIEGKLSEYEWVHLHHEDFTGQYGKFWASYRNTQWYKDQVEFNEETAGNLGFSKVWELKHEVARKLYEYVENGGYLFAMCSATDTWEIAIASYGRDVVESPFDGDPSGPYGPDTTRSPAFTNYDIIQDPGIYEHSTIDVSQEAHLRGEGVFFALYEFNAKEDPVPAMLVQNHVGVVREFLGQCTGFRRQCVRQEITVLGDVPGADEIKYISGNLGQGSFAYLGGHDPEDFAHYVGDPPTDLRFFPNSPGYRLILNNVLFPAAKKKELKT
ncbi:asparagine synthetase B [candidate division WOR-3 bacterium]|nr:asparagine synthetase B [candidate division WOR-3 bacterium]